MKNISRTPDRRLNFAGRLSSLGATVLLLWKVFLGGGQWMLWVATAMLLIAVVLRWKALPDYS